jgi:hypothetical protein
MHPDIATITGNRSIPGIPQARTTIHPGPMTRVSMISPTMAHVPHHDKFGEFLSKSNGVMTRVRMVNTTLRHLGIDCSLLDSLAGTGTVQLTTVQAMVQAGNRSGTRSALSQFRESVISLRDAYRGILVREDLPGETAQGVLSVAQSLDVTAVQVKIS